MLISPLKEGRNRVWVLGSSGSFGDLLRVTLSLASEDNCKLGLPDHYLIVGWFVFNEVSQLKLSLQPCMQLWLALNPSSLYLCHSSAGLSAVCHRGIPFSINVLVFLKEA